jgi:hypothetical protein
MREIMLRDSPLSFSGRCLPRLFQICTAVLLLGGSVAGTRAAQPGPIYGIDGARRGPSGIVLQLVKMSANEQDQIVRTINFTATAAFVDAPPGGAASEGHVQLGTPRQLLTDKYGILSRVIPVNGTEMFVQVQSPERGQTTITVLGPGLERQRELASFPVQFRDASDGAYAITRSGRYILLANATRVCVWDVLAWREVDRNAGPLGAMLKAMIEQRGNPGDWWLTDDLRYIPTLRATHNTRQLI